LRCAQAGDGLRVGGVAGQVKAAQALDCDDLAQLQAAQGFGQRIAGQRRHAWAR
jgi:hypothetical protein